jgi:hypothetical protein
MHRARLAISRLDVRIGPASVAEAEEGIGMAWREVRRSLARVRRPNEEA